MHGNYSVEASNNISIYASHLQSKSRQRVFITFLHAMAIGVCFYLSFYLVEFLHLTVLIAGIIVASYGIGTAVGGILGGKLSDKISPCLISVFSLIIEGGCFLILIALKDPRYLIINIFILGIAAYCFKTSNTVWIIDQFQKNNKEKLKIINILYTASNLGLGLAGLLVGALINYHFQSIFYVSSFLLFCSAIYFIFLESEHLHLQSKSLRLQAYNSENEIKNQNFKIFILMLFCLFSVGVIIGQRNVDYSIFIKQHFPHESYRAISFLVALNPLLVVLFQIPFVSLFNKFNKVILVGISAFVMGFGIWLMTTIDNFMISILSCIVYTFGEMLFFSMTQFIAFQCTPSEIKGKNMGLFQSTYALSMIIGPLVGGFLFHHFNSETPWILSLYLGTVCMLLCFYLNKNF